MQRSDYREDILWLGYVGEDELPVFYSMAEVFIYPSIYEGFGLPVLEAMACGTPVITSDTSSLPEVGGDAVLYTDPNSSTKLAQQIEILCSDRDLQKKHSELGLKRSANFTWQKTAEKYIQLFENLSQEA